MINNVALDVVIGLVFIYLLYSLLATVLSEIIATALGLRARNLKETINRMLTDEADEEKSFLSRLWDSFKLMKNPQNDVVNNFYDHPEIKYLGSSGIFRIPSSFKAISFSKTLISVILDNKPATREELDEKLKEIIMFGKRRAAKPASQDSQSTEDDSVKLDRDTAIYIRTLWQDSYGDIEKFKAHLETWFDRTMEQSTEWYKRKIQIVLLFLGFCMAWFFNADTIVMIGKLSTDKDAREKIVSMATAYIENNKVVADTCKTGNCPDTELKAKLDALLEVKTELEEDMLKANTLLGHGSWLPDAIEAKIDPKTKKKKYIPWVEAQLLPARLQNSVGIISLSVGSKLQYLFGLMIHHFAGYLLTAIAISLGAPFWFDLLNKLMKLRTSQKQEMDSPHTSSTRRISPLNREG